MKWIPVVLVLLLAGCTSEGKLAPDAALAVQCQLYASALRTAAQNKSKLSADQIKTVDTIKSINEPLCLEAAAAGQSGVDFDFKAALLVVLRTTQQLSLIGGNP